MGKYMFHTSYTGKGSWACSRRAAAGGGRR